jgi:hypothetical protein
LPNKVIVYTRHDDGGVSVNSGPSREVLRAMQCGGYWAAFPRGFVETQIERQIGAGINPDHARRFAHAVAFGGTTEAEAWDIIKDRDCARFGKLHELQDRADLPADRWFRDAWRRSANGGPVGIDLEKARPIQWAHIWAAVRRENERRKVSFEMLPPVPEPGHDLNYAIRHARDDEELRRIWPDGLITTIPGPFRSSHHP